MPSQLILASYLTSRWWRYRRWKCHGLRSMLGQEAPVPGELSVLRWPVAATCLQLENLQLQTHWLSVDDFHVGIFPVCYPNLPPPPKCNVRQWLPHPVPNSYRSPDLFQFPQAHQPHARDRHIASNRLTTVSRSPNPNLSEPAGYSPTTSSAPSVLDSPPPALSA